MTPIRFLIAPFLALLTCAFRGPDDVHNHRGNGGSDQSSLVRLSKSSGTSADPTQEPQTKLAISRQGGFGSKGDPLAHNIGDPRASAFPLQLDLARESDHELGLMPDSHWTGYVVFIAEYMQILPLIAAEIG